MEPDVPPVVHAPRKCQIHKADDIKKEPDEMISLRVIQQPIWKIYPSSFWIVC